MRRTFLVARGWLLRFVLAVALTALSGTLQPTWATKLVVRDDATVAWMTTNNSFAEDHQHGRNTFWQRGLLLQLGDYAPLEEGKQPQVSFTSVEFIPTRGPSYVFTPTSQAKPGENPFDWINIVADFDHTWDPPLNPKNPRHSFLLYQNDFPEPTLPCALMYNCVQAQGKSCPCDDDHDSFSKPIDPRCLRLRRLHSQMSTQALLLYWANQDDIDISIKPKTNEQGSPLHNNWIEFDLKEHFTARVYQATKNDLTGKWSMVPAPHPADDEKEAVFSSRHLKEIRVNYKKNGLGHGNKREPAWPTQGGG